MKFKYDDRAIICNCPGLNGRVVRVVGVAVDFGTHAHYIIEVYGWPNEQHPWRFIQLTEHCLKKVGTHEEA